MADSKDRSGGPPRTPESLSRSPGHDKGAEEGDGGRRPILPQKAREPDRGLMEWSVTTFLESAGVPQNYELETTARRVVSAWVDEFIDGYLKDPIEALGEPSRAPAKESGTVFVTGVDYTGVCPHHLLPYRGVAHIGYLPGTGVAGFSRLAAMLDVLAHRLTLQETLAQQVAETLVEGLGARGAGVILEAEQLCMTLRGVKRASSRAVVEASVGEFGRAELDRLWNAAGRGRSA